MHIYPINSLREEDVPIVGRELVNLSKLAQEGINVPEGIVVTPPEFNFSERSFHHEENEQVFNHHFEFIHRTILETAIPHELIESINDKNINVYELWDGLLNTWISQARSKLWREGKVDKSCFSAQPVFFVEKISASGMATFNPKTELADIDINQGNLSQDQIDSLSKIIEKAASKMYLSYHYQWIFDENFYIVKLIPYTPSDELNNIQDLPLKDPHQVLQDEHNKTTTKIFYPYDENIKKISDVDGIVFIKSNMFDLETVLLKLSETASAFSHTPILYPFEGFSSKGGLSEILENQMKMQEESETVLFVRNKQSLLNVQVVLPHPKSSEELIEAKQTLASMGISRKGTLKLWVEMAVPENFLNIESYIQAEFDGVVINFDRLIECLYGTLKSDIDYSVIFSFLTPALKSLHLNSMPVLVFGQSVLKDNNLRKLVELGVWGIILQNVHEEGIRSHLKYLEKSVFLSKFTHSGE